MPAILGEESPCQEPAIGDKNDSYLMELCKE